MQVGTCSGLLEMVMVGPTPIVIDVNVDVAVAESEQGTGNNGGSHPQLYGPYGPHHSTKCTYSCRVWK